MPKLSTSRMVLLLLVATPATARAQQDRSFPITIRVMTEHGDPVSDAHVRLVEHGGAAVAQRITNADGFAPFEVPRAGEYRLAVDRLGLAPWASGPLRLVGPQSDPIILRVPVNPIPLDSVVVAGDPRCSRTRPFLVRAFGRLLGRAPPGENAAMLPRVHAQAMSMLTAMIRQRQPGAIYIYRVTHEGVGSGENSQPTDTSLMETASPIEGPPPDVLATDGYITPADSSRDEASYHAPTPEVMTSESFTLSHCFRVVEQADSGLVGLAFEPVPGSENYDVRGVVWLDTIAGRPHRIEFHYTRLAAFLIDSGEWSDAMREARRDLPGAGRESRDIAQRHGMPRVGSKVYREHPTPDEDEFGGVILFGSIGPGGWDITRWEIRWPRLRGYGFLSSYSIGRTRGSSMRGVIVEITLRSRTVPYTRTGEFVRFVAADSAR